ncbi:hypothetical protein EDB84DRAFT_1680109 [Lactarius hengduanensis]|nr:hypothetical protein EDB84DRAFT_1680109 [Lactarius hengduanensis]
MSAVRRRPVGRRWHGRRPCAQVCWAPRCVCRVGGDFTVNPGEAAERASNVPVVAERSGRKDGVANVRDGGGEDLVTEEQVANTFSDGRFVISGCGAADSGVSLPKNWGSGGIFDTKFVIWAIWLCCMVRSKLKRVFSASAADAARMIFGVAGAEYFVYCNRKNLGKNAALSITSQHHSQHESGGVEHPRRSCMLYSRKRGICACHQAREPGYWAVELVATVIATDFADVFAGRSAMDTLGYGTTRRLADKIFAQEARAGMMSGLSSCTAVLLPTTRLTRHALSSHRFEPHTEYEADTLLCATRNLASTCTFTRLGRQYGGKYIVNSSGGLETKPAKGHPLGATGLAKTAKDHQKGAYSET